MSFVEKYRPKTLDEVYGQDNVITQIKGMLKNPKEFNQVIGIFGPSGVGKTSLAFLIACLINKIEYTKKHSDIMHCNLGSDRGIDNIRSTTSMANYKPKTKYRVIIADEIQCLTGAALSAVLVPLEDVPKQTIWILCTDKPQLLPTTVLRRAKKLYLQQPSPAQVIPLLERVVKKEKLNIPKKEKILLKIAEINRGQPSESLQSLESVSDYINGNHKASYEDLLKTISTSGKIQDTDLVAVKVLVACYLRETLTAIKGAQILGDPISALMLLINMNSYIISTHTKSKSFWCPAVREFDKYLKVQPKLKEIITIHNSLVNARTEALFPGNIVDNHFLVAKIAKIADISNR